jgi:hypothetical protein
MTSREKLSHPKDTATCQPSMRGEASEILVGAEQQIRLSGEIDRNRSGFG